MYSYKYREESRRCELLVFSLHKQSNGEEIGRVVHSSSLFVCDAIHTCEHLHGALADIEAFPMTDHQLVPLSP